MQEDMGTPHVRRGSKLLDSRRCARVTRAAGRRCRVGAQAAGMTASTPPPSATVGATSSAS
eukprot:1235017-Prymnesium_polylepis.2